MTKFMIYLFILTLLSPIAAQSDTGQSFFGRVQVERDASGGLKRVYLKNRQRFSEKNIVQNFVDDILAAQEKIKSANSTSVLKMAGESKDWPLGSREMVEQSLVFLKEYDLKPVLDDPSVRNAMEYLVQQAESEGHDFRVLAVPDNPSYFNANEQAMKIAMQALDLVKLAVGNSYGVNVAIFVIRTLFDMILERRTFFQNYILYHFDKYGPEKFGITRVEANKITSSVFESRIAWWDFWERNYAKINWDQYGQGKYVDFLVQAEKRKNSGNSEVSKWGEKHGFAFHSGEVGSLNKVLNLVNPWSVVSDKLSVGYDFSNTSRIRYERTLFYLLQMAIRLAPVPLVSTVFDFFMESMYIPQRQMEGVLFGYFEDAGLNKEANIVVRQSINPFLLMEAPAK
ncbi:MAG: hypothetical protein SGJ18_09935 [Pseudomonadota bacterium]|nr:hypothetical protein [Pseudomonadota bacterium]